MIENAIGGGLAIGLIIILITVISYFNRNKDEDIDYEIDKTTIKDTLTNAVNQINLSQNTYDTNNSKCVSYIQAEIICSTANNNQMKPVIFSIYALNALEHMYKSVFSKNRLKLMTSILEVTYITHKQLSSDWKQKNEFAQDFFIAIQSIKESIEDEVDIKWINENYPNETKHIEKCKKTIISTINNVNEISKSKKEIFLNEKLKASNEKILNKHSENNENTSLKSEPKPNAKKSSISLIDDFTQGNDKTTINILNPEEDALRDIRNNTPMYCSISAGYPPWTPGISKNKELTKLLPIKIMLGHTCTTQMSKEDFKVEENYVTTYNTVTFSNILKKDISWWKIYIKGVNPSLFNLMDFITIFKLEANDDILSLFFTLTPNSTYMSYLLVDNRQLHTSKILEIFENLRPTMVEYARVLSSCKILQTVENIENFLKKNPTEEELFILVSNKDFYTNSIYQIAVTHYIKLSPTIEHTKYLILNINEFNNSEFHKYFFSLDLSLFNDLIEERILKHMNVITIDTFNYCLSKKPDLFELEYLIDDFGIMVQEQVVEYLKLNFNDLNDDTFKEKFFDEIFEKDFYQTKKFLTYFLSLNPDSDMIEEIMDVFDVKKSK